MPPARSQSRRTHMHRCFMLGVATLALAAVPVSAQSIRPLKGHHDAVYAIAFRPDGQRLASASFDHTIKVWNVASGATVRTFNGHRDKVLALAYAPDGTRLA